MTKLKKKLCIVIPTHWEALMGGAQYQGKVLVDALIPTGSFEIYYLARRTNPLFEPKGYEIVKTGDHKGFRRFGHFFDTPNLIKSLREIQPDIIYQRVGCAYTGIAAGYAKRKKSKIVWHIALDLDVLPFDRTLTANIIFRYVDKKLLEYGIRRADNIIAQTKYQSELLQRHYGRKPTAVIPNFHPFPREQIKKTYPLKVLWVANFKPAKQPEVFIKLARDLRHMSDVHFMMIGASYPDASRQNDLMEKMQHLSNLTYFGRRSQDEVNEIVASSHILVNTSLYEGFSNTFIQAWMREVPVVSLNVNPDGVFNDNGIGIISGNYRKLRQDVLELIEDSELRETMGKKARTYAFEKHSEKNIWKLVELLTG